MKYFLVIIFTSALFSCATGYHKKGFSGGYWERKMSNNMFEVGFRGNGYTSSETVNSYFKRRCAELTLKSGFSHFVLLNERDKTSYHSTGQTTRGTANTYSGGLTYSETTTNSGFHKSRSEGVIMMFKDGEQPPHAISSAIYLENFPE
jgi:hypothetical protein